MPPRGFTNPPPKTESAREARKAFFCDLCNKGYARQNEFDAHESSYDHQHRKRLQELKAMNKSMDSSASKARRSEEKSSGLIKIAAFGGGGGAGKKDSAAAAARGGTGFKKGGFKKAFGAADDDDDDGDAEDALAKLSADATSGSRASEQVRRVGGDDAVDAESDTDDEDYERYDPRRPTDCFEACKGCA